MIGGETTEMGVVASDKEYLDDSTKPVALLSVDCSHRQSRSGVWLCEGMSTGVAIVTEDTAESTDQSRREDSKVVASGRTKANQGDERRQSQLHCVVHDMSSAASIPWIGRSVARILCDVRPFPLFQS